MAITVIPVKAAVVADTDIESTLKFLGSFVYNGLTASAGSGLTVNIASGNAVIGGHFVSDTGSSVSVPASTTSTIWLQLTRSSGQVTGAGYVVSATQPADSIPICNFVSGASSITSVSDARVVRSFALSQSGGIVDVAGNQLMNALLELINSPSFTQQGRVAFDVSSKMVKYYDGVAMQILTKGIDVNGSASVATTETTLFTESNLCLLAGWILLPGNSATWTLKMYVPSSSSSAWHTVTISTGTTAMLVKIGATAVINLNGVLQDVKITATSSSSTAATVYWAYKKIAMQ